MPQTLRNELGLTEDQQIGTTSSSAFLGSPTYDLVPFHVDVGQSPVLGEYVFIERDDDSCIHYGRISGGTEENQRADPNRLQQNQAYQVGQRDARPSDRSPHVTRVLEIEVLGEVYWSLSNTLDIREPKLLAQTGRKVYRLAIDRVPWLLGTPRSPDDGLHLGSVESGDQSTRFFLPIEALARHLMVAGKTGVGKSYAVGVLIEELVRHGIPVVSFDVLGDVVPATQDLNGVIFHAGQDFQVPYSVIGLAEFLSFIPNLTREQSEIVAAAYERIFSEALGTLDSESNINIPITRLLDEIKTVGDDFGQAPVAGRAARRVSAAFERSRLLSEGTGPWLAELKQRPLINVFLGRLGQNRRNLVVGATARLLQTLRRQHRIPPFVLVLDEAHLFLPSGGEMTPSTYVIREMIRTARHDAIGIILISQSPGSLDKQVMLTCNTRMIFALDRDDLKLVSGTMGDLPEATLNRIPKQAKGTAIISSGIDIMRHPALIRIRMRTTREGAPTPNLAEEVAQWRAQNKH